MTDARLSDEDPYGPVLIVEDSLTQGRIICRMFARMGAETVLTHTLKEAREQLSQRAWRLVLMDVFLERENTLEHISELRDLAQSAAIAVMSAGQRDDPVAIRTMLNRARRERADYLLPKPFSFEDVKQICFDLEDRARASAA